jgi:serine/threonine protein kinase
MFQPKIVGKHFQITSALNNGGFGQTFLAEDLRSPDNLKCVVKQLKPQTDDPKVIDLAARLFEEEVIALQRLGKHPQIPSLIDYFEENGEFYFVQEYIAGNTFARELGLGKVYNQSKVIEIISQLLDVLSFVHGQNVIHRDIKPENLINRTTDGKIVLIDFGAVKQVTNQASIYPNQTPQNTIAIGSDGFMPPEQLAGQPKFSSDVYAVGMFAVQLLTQTHPTRLRQNQRTGEWIWQDKTNVNPRFAEIVSQMIRYDFRQRFSHAIEANNALKRWNLNGEPQQNNEVRRQNESFERNFTNRQTQTANFTPISGFQPNPQPVQPINYRQPGYAQPNFQPIIQTPPEFPKYLQPLQPQQSLLEKYAGNSRRNDNSQPRYAESVSLGSLAFDDWSGNSKLRFIALSGFCFFAFFVILVLFM